MKIKIFWIFLLWLVVGIFLWVFYRDSESLYKFKYDLAKERFEDSIYNQSSEMHFIYWEVIKINNNYIKLKTQITDPFLDLEFDERIIIIDDNTKIIKNLWHDEIHEIKESWESIVNNQIETDISEIQIWIFLRVDSIKDNIKYEKEFIAKTIYIN